MRQERISIEYRHLADLIPDSRNPRRNEMAVKPVAESIRQFGMRVPIVIDQQGNIIAGHSRYKACESLGMDEVPCVTVDQLTLKQKRAFQLADNKTGELASWDQSLLAMELDSLASIFDVSSLGFVSDSKEPKETKQPPKDADSDGMITCPRCGKRFNPDAGLIDHFDGEEADLF